MKLKLVINSLVYTFQILFILSCVPQGENQIKEFKVPTTVNFIRAYGNNDEKLPPILILNKQNNKYVMGLGSEKITIEFDIKSNITPSLFVKFVHCDYNWNETENVFINSSFTLKTSNINWQSATYLDDYYSHRGRVVVPDYNVSFKYGGNYKAQICEYDNPDVVISETRFFVIDPKANSRIYVNTDFTQGAFNSSLLTYNIQTSMVSNENLYETQLNTNVIYKMNRWYEPYFITQNESENSKQYRYAMQTSISGFSAAEKRYRIFGIPADNEYRVMQMTNMAEFPRNMDVVRLPFKDIIRRGSFWDRDDNGVLNTDYLSSYNDDYVFVEFVLDPQGFVSDDDVFVAGSFNNWHPDKTWQMIYDEKDELYKVRNWIRRGRHNYLYGSGKYNIDKNCFDKISFDEFEGTSSGSHHTFYSFVYYREFEFGGYDNIISATAGDLNGLFR